MHSYMFKVLRVGEPCPSMRINAPDLAQRYWNRVIKKQDWFDENKEHLVVLLLSTQMCVEGYSLVAIGSLNESIAHPREIFRAAVAGGAYGIVVIHNHPSGYPQPSQHDVALTRRLADAADLLQIKLLDHVIIGRANRQLFEDDDVEHLAGVRMTRKARQAVESRRISRQGYYSFKEAFLL
jgi:DNA repair protein RadC